MTIKVKVYVELEDGRKAVLRRSPEYKPDGHCDKCIFNSFEEDGECMVDVPCGQGVYWEERK